MSLFSSSAHYYLNLAVGSETLEEVPLGLVPVLQEEAPVDAVEDEVAEHVHKQLLGFFE